MAKEIRVRCPFCNHRVLTVDFGELHRLEMWIKKFGGRYPKSKVGVMEWIPIDYPEVMEAYRLAVQYQLNRLATSFGYALRPRIIPVVSYASQPFLEFQSDNLGEVSYLWSRG